MNTHFLSDIQQKRENFKKYAQKAVEFNWISQQEYDEFISKIENSKLVIGVIGQMKAGKSTFLNALIFNDEVLPAATTPMTASLSILTYGPEKKLEAEFYTTQEWEELKMFATLNEKDYENDTNQQSKIKAAKEIVSKGIKIESQISTLLGTKKQDAFENLIEYVGADGKYIAITKSVKIEYPLDYLKGVEIVDTPGFNDPVTSREQRTKDFLQHADVVIMLLYAGRAFDATDNDIIFNKVRTIGIGKLLIGVNKYDINYSQGETESQMINYVKEQLLNASKQHSSNSIAELIKERDPLLISANMALMAKMDLSKIKNNDNLKFYYNKALDDFEISSQKQMLDKSLMPQFEQAIQAYILDDKDKILINKPLNLIKQKGENKQVELAIEIEQINNTLIIKNKPDYELEDLVINISKAKNKLIKKIEGLKLDMEEILFENTKDLISDIKSFILDKKNYFLNQYKDNDAWYKSDYSSDLENISKQFKNSIEIFLNNTNSSYNKKINRKLKFVFDEFTQSIEDICEKHLEDFDNIIISKKANNIFLNNSLSLDLYYLLDLDDIDIEIYRNSNFKYDIEQHYSKINYQLIKDDTDRYLNFIDDEITNIIITNFIIPLEEKAEENQNKLNDRESEIKELNNKISLLKNKLIECTNEIETLKILEHTI